jgi:geranylgeranyl reductase family protein
MIDVCVVGAGPAGLVLAARLASRGFAVTVAEEHDVVGDPVHCTGVMSVEAIADLSLPAEAVLNQLSTVRFFAPGGATFSYTTPQPEATVIDRGVFDAALAARAEAAGAIVLRGQKVQNIDVAGSAVRISLAGRDIDARAAVLACGANYRFQRKFQMGMPVAFLQSAQLEMRCEAAGDVEVHFGREISPKGFAWAVPVTRPGGSFVRVGAMAQSGADRSFTRMLRRIAERWRLLIPRDVTPRRRLLPLGPLPRTYADRVIAVGDSAGLVKPTTGGGIYYSVVSGELGADVLAEALAADALDAATLSEYERQWRRRFQPEFDAQLSLRQLAERLVDSDINDIFDLVRTDGLMQMIGRVARFNQHRELITELVKYPPSRRILFRRVVGAEAGA